MVAGLLDGSLLLDAASVHRFKDRGLVKARAWTELTAWSAIDVLDHGATDRVDLARQARLKSRLAGMSTTLCTRLMRGRCQPARYYATEPLRARLRDNVTLTGLTAVAHVPHLMERFGLPVRDDVQVEGYVARSALRSYEAAFFLRPDPAGNVLLRATDAVDTHGGVACVAAVSLDLMDSHDSIAREAGRTHVEAALRRVALEIGKPDRKKRSS